ncbi:hypothetical protein [Actinomadura sp. NEAU-AAG7]|uniref:hypothetical protein n=1 Tax=Actinomadura sp. NEAU-AAG7 TaxID=2839640 RepID=UPI001BE4CF59|nr:hypothetical protein [Actinomadura sp. NEAU-AAG7]MBT2213003.1 hypothetical protein [Actinomadura sp. NEAU-AAG7]
MPFAEPSATREEPSPLSGGPLEDEPYTEWKGGRHERTGDSSEERGGGSGRTVPDVPSLPPKGLSAEPPAGREVQWAPRPPEPPAEPPAGPQGPMADPARREALADAFVAEFAGSSTWRAMLAVLEGAFPGLGMAATLTRRTDEIWQTMEGLDRPAAARLGLPAWLDDSGMVFDLSAHLGERRKSRGGSGPPRASRPYVGAFVIDTLDPLRYHRAVGGPLAPGEGTLPPPDAREDDDTGVVIVANLTSAGVRVLDSVALWRYAGRVVTGTLREGGRADSGARTRRALRALRRVVFVDPDLGLGLALRIDAARTPRCLLAFRVDDAAAAPRFVRP